MIASKIRSSLFRWPLFISYSITLYIFHTLPPEKIPSVGAETNDKILHFLVSFLLTLLAFRAFLYSSRPFFNFRAGVKSVGFSLFYGAFLEWVQLSVPGREASLNDWMVDALGVFAASGILRRVIED